MALRRTKKRTTGTWSRKGKPKRSKEIWHFPKRASLIQAKGFIEVINNLGFDGKSWSKGRKETLNTELAKRGYTQSGSPLTAQSLRTFEAMMKYLGLIYVDNSGKRPIIRITEAGMEFLKHPTDALRLQMLKLQLTNPLILKDCINIKVFPFRTTLNLLLRLGYLTYEEIGYILFTRMKHQLQYKDVLNEILSFRCKPESIKEGLLKEFLSTPEGNVVLVQAPTVGYYVSLCIGTDLCEREDRILKIKSGKDKKVAKILNKFSKADVYDFDDDLPLWIEYYGKPKRFFPPRDTPIKLKGK